MKQPKSLEPSRVDSVLDKERPATRLHDPRAVLIIDNDLSSCEIAEWTLTHAGYRVRTAASGSEGIAAAKTSPFDFALIDLRLPDMDGTEVVRVIRAETGRVRFAIFSGYLTIQTTVEAMKLGAVDVIEKPLTTEVLLALVEAALSDVHVVPSSTQSSRAARAMTAPAGPLLLMRPRSAAERWALHVIKGCESNGDLKTLEDWATYVGVSYSTLCESCRLVGIQPHDARDLMRVLRAVMKAPHDGCHPSMLLDVSDRRTMKSLLNRAALVDEVRAGSVSVEQFIRTQKFVTRDHEALGVLQTFLGCFAAQGIRD